MNCNVYEIESFLKETHWDYSAGFSEEDAEEFLESIWYEGMPNYDYEIGATKLVIIPTDLDYVIKIPYNLATHFGEYFDFNGLPQGFDNYCEYELHLYEVAHDAGWGNLFLPTEYIGNFAGIPIYIQAKAEDYINTYHDYATEDSKKAIMNKRKENRNFIPLSLPFDWVACCYDVLHSFDKLRQFFCFLENEKISRDLHRANIGFYKNKPVIIDYGGYFEEI